MSRPRKLRTSIPAWAEDEAVWAVRDMHYCGAAALACLLTIAEELKKPDPSWETIQAAIRAARRASHCRFGLNFRRLENRLGNLFSERKRDWARP